MTDCKTRYPIFLVHGLNCRDTRPVPYWGRIPKTLEAHGAKVFWGCQDAWGTVEENGRTLERRLWDILEREGCGRVNFIAHSKGGLEARYLISTLDLAERAASLTTICTPHRGSLTAAVWSRRRALCAVAAPCLELFWRGMGDRRPDVRAVLRELTPEAMAEFNAQNPDSPLVYYQSYGAALEGKNPGLLAGAERWLCRADGVTDGLVSPRSAVWGVDRGVLKEVSHQDVVDLWKRDLDHFSVLDFYIGLVRELAEQGF